MEVNRKNKSTDRIGTLKTIKGGELIKNDRLGCNRMFMELRQNVPFELKTEFKIV